MLTADDLRLILDTLEAKYGRGYSADPRVKKLRDKLSLMLEMAQTRERDRDTLRL